MGAVTGEARRGPETAPTGVVSRYVMLPVLIALWGWLALYGLILLPGVAHAQSQYDGMYEDVFGTGGYDSTQFWYCGYGAEAYDPGTWTWNLLDCGEFEVDPGSHDSINHVLIDILADEDASPRYASSHLVIIPPEGVTDFDLRCDGARELGDRFGGSWGSSAQANYNHNNGKITRTGFQPSGDSWSAVSNFSLFAGSWDSDALLLGENGVQFSSSSFLGVNLDYQQDAAATGNHDYAAVSSECWIVDYDGSWTPPATPTPVPTPTSVPTDTIIPWPTYPAWVPPQTYPVSAGLTPQPTACSQILWGYTLTVPVWDVTAGFPEVEVCTEPQDFELQFMNINVGQWLLLFGLIATVGVLLSIVKRS